MPQAGYNWNGEITSFFMDYGMTQVREDLCLFALIVEGEIVILASLYVENIPMGLKPTTTKLHLSQTVKPDTM